MSIFASYRQLPHGNGKIAFLEIIIVFSCIFTTLPVLSMKANESSTQGFNEHFSSSRSYFDEFKIISKYAQGASTLSKNGNFLKYNHNPNVHNILIDLIGTNKNPENEQIIKSLIATFETTMLENADKSSCVEDVGRIILNLRSESKDKWSIPFIDSSGKPGPSISLGWLNFIGNLDQCREARAPPVSTFIYNKKGFNGKYCNIPIVFGPNIMIQSKIGVCFPDTCSSTQMTDIFNELLVAAKLKLNISGVSFGPAQCSTGKTEITTATIFAIIILATFGGLVLVGTAYDFVFVQWNSNSNSVIDDNNIKQIISNGTTNSDMSSQSQNVNGNNQVESESAPLIPKETVNIVIQQPAHKHAWIGKCLVAFSLYTNCKKLLSTSKSSGSIECIYGIRFISITWVFLGHCFLISMTVGSLNVTTALPKFLQRWTFDGIANALVSVDTFFTLSGLLTSYLTLQALYSKGPKGINWLLFYFHRFWRLTPPYMCALVLYLGLQQYLGDGPLWGDEQPVDKQMCEKNWWTNLLYVNNFVGLNRGRPGCFAHAWYLANDMQFYLVSPLMLIPFCYHWIAGVASCSVFLLVSWITTLVLSFEDNWGDTILTGVVTNFGDYYFKPWCRIGPYVVGILAGYVLVSTKGRPIHLKWCYVVTGWCVAIATALAVLYGLRGELSGEYKQPQVASAMYNAVARSAWGACVCWVIVACHWGYGGPVNTFLSWSLFSVLGRLTYSIYLIHFNIIFIFFMNLGAMIFINVPTISVIFLGLLLFTITASFVFVLVFESPMLGLERAFLRKV